MTARRISGYDLTGVFPVVEIQRAEYDHETWTDQLAGGEVFTQPLRTGIWAADVARLSAAEQPRPDA